MSHSFGISQDVSIGSEASEDHLTTTLARIFQVSWKQSVPEVLYLPDLADALEEGIFSYYLQMILGLEY